MSKSISFTTIVKLVLCVILVINVCIHICDYCSHICNYNVDLTKWNHKCEYSLWRLHVWMEKQMKVHIFHPILNGFLDEWKFSYFCNWSQLFWQLGPNKFFIYHILMIKTYGASLVLQYLLDNQLVSNYLLVILLFIDISSINIYISNYDIFINVIYYDYLIILHTI